MVTTLTGVLVLFRDFGLSAAAIQRPNVTDEQISTLFWINIAVGILLALLTAAMAPVIATFYHEPRPSEHIRFGLQLSAQCGGIQPEHSSNGKCALPRWQ
jgi:O-antigen/teichoic acid export membrane protein